MASSSSAFFGSMTMIATITILLINSDGRFGMVTVVEATHECNGEKVGEAYDTSVGKLVYKLQELVIQDTKTWKATWTVESVTGHASCDWVGTSNDCSTCLGWAATDLFVDCKGSESGSSSSNGLGRCDMNFKRA